MPLSKTSSEVNRYDSLSIAVIIKYIFQIKARVSRSYMLSYVLLEIKYLGTTIKELMNQ